jgi:hypothetical protein
LSLTTGGILPTASLAVALVVACDGSPSSGPPAAEAEPVVLAVEPPGALADTLLTLRVLGTGFESDNEVEIELDGEQTDLVQVSSTRFVNGGVLLADLQIGKGAVNAVYSVRASSRSKRGIPIEGFEVFVTPGLLGLLPGDQAGQATAINESDEIVGTSWVCTCQPRVFYYRNGVLEEVGEGEAWDISNSGRIAGYRLGTAQVWDRIGGDWVARVLPRAGQEGFAYSITSTGEMVAGTAVSLRDGGVVLLPVVWRFGQGEWESIPLPTDGLSMSAISINDAGMVLGNHEDWSQPVVWMESGGEWRLRHLPVPAGEQVSVGNEINDNGDVVGFMGRIPSRAGVIWRKTADGWSPPQATTPMGVDNRAHAVNNIGEVAGVSVFPGEFDRAFFFNREGELLNLGAPVPPYSLAIDVNDHGVVVGAAGGDPSGLFRPIRWPVVYRR